VRAFAGLEQPEAVLDLGEAQREIGDLVALHEAQLDDQPRDQLLSPQPRVLGVAAPAGERVADGAAQLVAVDADETREVVGEVVCGFGCQ
jgi:hypothetical protein